LNVRIKTPREVRKAISIFGACVILHNLLLHKPNTPEQWYEQCEEDIGVECGVDRLYGADLCVEGEGRREQVKHSLIELFNAAPF